MPSLGADMESAEVTEWLVKPGTPVKKGDVIVVVETHKGAIEVEVFQEGVVTELCAKEGDVLPVGALLARIAGPGETVAPPPAPPPVPTPKPAPPIAAPPPAPPHPSPPPAAAMPQRPETIPGRAKVSPAARRRAAELGIDPDTLHGTGIDGSVTLADVEAAPRPAAQAQQAPDEAAPRAPQ